MIHPSHVRQRVSAPRAEFWAGSRAIAPLVIGAIPFGILFGTLSTSSGLSFGGALAMSAFVFAGSAQFIALGLIASGTTVPLIVLTTFVVNLRHLLYAIGLVPHVRHLPPIWKLLVGVWLTDETFAVAIARYHQPDRSPNKHWFYLGAALLMYLNWQLCTLVGLLMGQHLTNVAHLGLDMAMSITFIGMIVPTLTTPPMLVGVLAAGIVALWTAAFPHQLGLLVATVAGVFAGTIAERIQAKRIRHE